MSVLGYCYYLVAKVESVQCGVSSDTLPPGDEGSFVLRGAGIHG